MSNIGKLLGAVEQLVMSVRMIALAGLMTFGLVGCMSGPGSVGPAPVVSQGASQAQNGTVDYKLGSGDKLRVNVYGEPDLSGEFDVTGAGKISLPLIGQVQAAGLTINGLEEEVAGKLTQGYLTNPKVSVEVLNYRPFYIIGEVGKPGEYPYTNSMNVLNAVAVAGGFTYRANTDSVYITRGGDQETLYPISQSVPVLPGDIVRIPERYF